MARVCACCEHPQRTVIEAQLVSGRSLRAVAADFGLSPAALHRHAQNHLSASLSASAQAHYSTVQSNTYPVQILALAEAGKGGSELQPVAPAAVAPQPYPPVQSRPLRALMLEEHSFAAPQPTIPAQEAQGRATAPSEITVAPSLTQAAPLDPYALACELRESAVRILRAAEERGDGKTALQANQTALAVLDRLSRLMPRNGSDTTSPPLQVSPEWARLRSVLMTALEAFPEARIAVAEALSEMGAPQ